MRMKRFLAASVSSALEQVKRELGPDAVIISTEKKRIKEHGTKGFRTLTEVIAAVDRPVDEESPSAHGRSAPVERAPSRKLSSESAEDQAERLKRLAASGTFSSSEGPGSQGSASEIMALKEALSQVSAAVSSILGSSASAAESDRASAPLLTVNRFLACLDLDASTQQALAARIFPHFAARPISLPALAEWLDSFICRSLRQGAQAESMEKGPCWWAFIGPTGVGKTTTLAKIAARLRFMQGRKGVLVSVDSYRLGAAEQLRKYAELMELPFETAATSRQLLRIFAENRDADFILVDTTGRNPFSQRHCRELQRIFDTVPELMAQVMLCSSYDVRQIVKAINFYKRFPVAGYTLTKTDETDSRAAALLAVICQNLPLSYITNGQRVPEDIARVSLPLVRQMVMDPLRSRLALGPEQLRQSAAG